MVLVLVIIVRILIMSKFGFKEDNKVLNYILVAVRILYSFIF
jgi:hypothetical protein